MVPAFMESDHLSPTNIKSILKTSNSTAMRSRCHASALSTLANETCETYKSDFDRWYEGELLAGTVFQ